MFRASQYTDVLRAGAVLRTALLFAISMLVLLTPSVCRGKGPTLTWSLPHAAWNVIDLSNDSIAQKSRNDKWFISVISMQNCVACERLKYDFAHAESLAPFVDAQNHFQSWSHYNVFAREEASQMRRWQSIHLEMYPTIIVQPPLSGEFGDPATVVWQRTGYDGNDRRLAEEIRAAITRYVDRLPQRRHSAGPLAGLPQAPGVAVSRVAQHEEHLREKR